MSKTLLLLSLSIIIFGLMFCNPDDEPVNHGEFRLGPEGEAYIKFEPGSYWIYENDSTSERDTVVMDYYRSSMRHFKGDRNEFYREDINLRWVATSGVYEFSTPHPYVDATPLDVGLYHFGMPCSRVGVGAVSMIYFPFSLAQGGLVSGQSTYLNRRYDSLQINEKWYYDVVEFEIDNDWSWDFRPYSNHTKYYWSKNIGMIKKVLLEEQSEVELEIWNLVDYKIN